MPHSPFGRSRPKINYRARPVQSEATLDDFSGGLDLSDNDLRLNTSFAKVLRNWHRDVDGTQSVRWGTRFKWNIAGVVTGTIVDGVYFRDKIVVVTTTGQIATITETGTVTAVWNTAIAAALPGAPAAWSATTSVDFTEFRNELVIMNGVDKPLIMSKTHTVKYLQDLATGSNVNTPIAKYCTTVGNYVVMAGVAASPDVIYVSSTGTSGTWPGDTPPNDSVSFNVAAYSAQTGGDLRGLSSFRNYLFAHFATTSVVIVLGEFDSTVHKPRPLDTLPRQGIISHRMSNLIDNELIFADEQGVWQAKRNQFGDAMENEKFSSRIQTDYINDVGGTSAARLGSFSLQNSLENRILYFLKQDSGYLVYVLSFQEGLKKRAWNTFDAMNFTGGCSSIKGRIFLFMGTKIFQYGNTVFPDEDYTADLMMNYDSVWATATGYVVGDKVLQGGKTYICAENHTSDVFATDLADDLWEEYEGEAIDTDWEFPWTDTNARMTKKKLSYLGIDTVGTATFTVEFYADRFIDAPALSMEFVAGDSGGYGNGDQPYGGGRRAIDERMWGTPLEFKLLKIRIKSNDTKRLQISGMTLLYTRGTYKR